MTSDIDAARLREIAKRKRDEERAQAVCQCDEEREAWNRLRDDIGLRGRSAVLDKILQRCTAAAERGSRSLDFPFRIDSSLSCVGYPSPEQEAAARKIPEWSLLDKSPDGPWRMGPHGEWLLEQLRGRGFRVVLVNDAVPDPVATVWYPPRLAVDW